ncbi:MAG TPA: hypothetical protein VJH04_01030 [archaeon]|nr:hypothetical protein [archaeon]
MFDLKIIITIIATLGLLLGYLGTNPVVSGFFGSVGERFSFGDNTQRDIDFSLSSDKYVDVDFSDKGPLNITVNGYTTATLRTGNLVTNKTVGIYGFHGSGSTVGNRLTLEGKMSKVQLPEITVAVQETVKADSIFTSFEMENLDLGEYTLQNVSGTLVARGTTTQFTGDITIASPRGTFSVNEDNTTLKITGKAGKITLSNGFVID